MIVSRKIFKSFYTCSRNHQVTVLGGATDIGQTICLLLRAQPNITKLIVHDTQAQTPGVILDLSHVPTSATVKGYVGEDSMEKAIANSEVVIAAGGITQNPGISEKLWLSTNTAFIKSVSREVARMRPMPFVGIVTEPLNSLVPMAAEVIRNHGAYDPKKLFGITNIDALQARTLFANEFNLDPRNVFVPVIGGHSSKTCIPLLSRSQPTSDVNDTQAKEFTVKFRKINDQIVNAKRGYAPALSIAYSVYLFTRSILDVLDGKHTAVNAFVENNDFGTEYFSGIVHINHEGAKEMQRYNNLTSYECNLLEDCIEYLRKDVLKGKKILEYA